VPRRNISGRQILPQYIRQEALRLPFEETDISSLDLLNKIVPEKKCPSPIVEHACQVDNESVEIYLDLSKYLSLQRTFLRRREELEYLFRRFLEHAEPATNAMSKLAPRGFVR
jgi:hypothetical protein